jgi:bifunctional non-homologous end joining protein LigD
MGRAATNKRTKARRATRDLAEYRRKRDFGRTPEPGGRARRNSGTLSFVVQKHAARRLHYDFRLEMNGVMKSWAVTKGPSLDPRVRRLAVHVEDHPIEYSDFEGVIPQGQYGGGTVMIWDRGNWEPAGDPEGGYRKGRLSFRLRGRRMKGNWALVRMDGRGGGRRENWLLMKKNDESADSADGGRLVRTATTSVVSKRSMERIAAAADRVWNSNRTEAASEAQPAPKRKRAPRAAPSRDAVGKTARLPEFIEPQLATLVAGAPGGEGWVHEIKFDGYRLQCRIENGKAVLRTRKGIDWTHRFPTLAAAAARLPVKQAIVDGEVVALQSSGVPSFAELQNALKAGRESDLVFFAFDLLFADGRDLRKVGLKTRKERLRERLRIDGSGVIRYSEHHSAEGPDFLQSACRMALEGVVSKRADAPYESGRSRSWLKSKCVEQQEFVIGGFTRPSTGGRGIGAIVLGYYRNGELRYAGRVGTGFGAAASADLRKRLDKLVTSAPPFARITSAQRRGVTWVAPQLVCEVEFRSWTHDGLVRQGSFQGLREDKPAKEVSLEMPNITAHHRDTRKDVKKTADPIESVRLTHPDRVLYPETGLTKRGLAEYYVEIADWILPEMAQRPLSLVRCPDGLGKGCFYQKHLGSSPPDDLRCARIKERAGTTCYAMIKDLKGLLSLVQMSVLEVHPWGSRIDRLEQPDRMIFDLDPDPALPWSAVVAAARETRERLQDTGLESFVKTTGGKGLHVVVPLSRRHDWAAVHGFAKRLAEAMAADAPERYTARMAKAGRKGKIFIDYVRNARGATAVAPYSARAKPPATVATPVAWDELDSGLTPDRFTVATVPRRLAGLRDDPWRDLRRLRQSLGRSA